MLRLMERPEIREALLEQQQTQRASFEAAEAVRATLTPEQARVFNEYSDHHLHALMAEFDVFRALLLAHLGPFAPVILPLLNHCNMSESGGDCDCPEVS